MLSRLLISVMEKTNCSCKNCQLKSLFFSHVNEQELNNICNIKVEKHYSKGEIITNEGDTINEFLYMKEGLVKLSKKSINAKDQIISFSKPFDYVNLLSVFSSDVYKYSVTAIDNTTVCTLDLDIIKSYALKNPKFTLNLMSHISEASDKILLDNLEIKRKHLKGRIAHVLIYFSEHIYKSDEFELPISRREIAEYIGMTTENVIRTLSEFRKDKIIKIFGKDILIEDKKRLQNISDFG